MELVELLRQRSQTLSQSVQVDCGTLGTLTAKALSLRECRALSAGPDGDRAVLYAACRELQSAGEQLRREGRVFRPDEIMQLVTDEEAATGARAVRTLSGMDSNPEPTGDTLDESPAKGVETESQEGRTRKNSPNPPEQDAGLTTMVEREEVSEGFHSPSHGLDCGPVSSRESGRQTTRAAPEMECSDVEGEAHAFFHTGGGEKSFRSAAGEPEMAENPGYSSGTLMVPVGPVETAMPDQDDVISLCEAVKPARRGTRAGSDQTVQEDAERSGEAPAVCPAPSPADWAEADPGGKPDFTEAGCHPVGEQERRRITTGRELFVEQRQADNPRQLESQQTPPPPTVTAEFAERMARALLEGLRRAAGAR